MITEEQRKIIEENKVMKTILDHQRDNEIRLAKMENLLNGKIDKNIENILRDMVNKIRE